MGRRQCRGALYCLSQIGQLSLCVLGASAGVATQDACVSWKQCGTTWRYHSAAQLLRAGTWFGSTHAQMGACKMAPIFTGTVCIAIVSLSLPPYFQPTPCGLMWCRRAGCARQLPHFTGPAYVHLWLCHSALYLAATDDVCDRQSCAVQYKHSGSHGPGC